MRRLTTCFWFLIVPLSVTLSDCSSAASDMTSDLGAPPPDLSAPPLDLSAPPPDLSPPGTPITAPPGQWTWVDFPDAVCDDNSPTGIGVNLANNKNLLVYFEGGGACWDY